MRIRTYIRTTGCCGGILLPGCGIHIIERQRASLEPFASSQLLISPKLCRPYQLTTGRFFLPVNFRQKCIICDPCGSMIDCWIPLARRQTGIHAKSSIGVSGGSTVVVVLVVVVVFIPAYRYHRVSYALIHTLHHTQTTAR